MLRLSSSLDIVEVFPESSCARVVVVVSPAEVGLVATVSPAEEEKAHE